MGEQEYGRSTGEVVARFEEGKTSAKQGHEDLSSDAPTIDESGTASRPKRSSGARRGYYSDDSNDGSFLHSGEPQSSPKPALPTTSGPAPPDIGSSDHYAVLQVSSNAEPEVIQAAYRQLARKYHPDRHPEVAATEWMQKLNTAYTVLSAPRQRATYDALQRMGSKQSPQGAKEQTAPIIYLSASELDFGTVTTEEPVVSRVAVAVYAYSGEIRVTPTRPWLSVQPAAFRGLVARIAITANPQKLPLGELQRGRVLLQAGETRATIDLEARAVPPGTPGLDIESKLLIMDPVPQGDLAVGLLRIENSGGGLLEGTITSSLRWLQVEETTFCENEVRLDVTARTGQLRPDKTYTAELHVSSNGGGAVVEVQVTTRPRE